MKEYIKKFDSIASADGHVIDNPFVSTIVTQGGSINLTCNQPDKKLKLEDGQIIISDNISLSLFYVNNIAYQFENGMTWYQWIDSEYNTCNAYAYDGGNDELIYFPSTYMYKLILDSNNNWVFPYDDNGPIENEYYYTLY